MPGIRHAIKKKNNYALIFEKNMCVIFYSLFQLTGS